MGKRLTRILAIILSIGVLASVCAAPLSVGAVPADETYDTYDVVTYRDLLSGGNPVTASRTSLSGNPKFAYNATSPSYSVIFKYRWTAGSYNTDKPYYVFYFDAWSGGAYPFCLAVKSPGYSGLGAAAGANGAWHLDPSKNDHIVQMSSPIVAGQNYDIEHGRLKVATGTNAGKYYVYVKVDGELIYDYYYDGDNGNGTYGSKNQAFDPNYLRFTDGAADNYISAIPEPDVYDTYDEIAFSDLYEGSTPIGGTVKDGSGNYTYNATSPSYSVKFSYRWTAATAADKKFTTYFDDWKYPFCFAVKTPNQSGFGATAGPNGSWHLVPSDSSMIVDMDEPIVGGQDYDIEVGRLKVIGGDNQGKYYVYFKVNNELIKSYYYDGVSNGTYGSSNTPLSNNIIISAPAGNKFSAIPTNSLKFGSDGKFKTVIFSDIQENTSDQNGIARLVGIMERAIQYENPDLIILLGDNTELNIQDPEVDLRALLNQILAPIVDAGIPYAFVFGNHDNQSYYSGQRTDKDAMLAVYQTIGDCRTTDPDPSIFGTGTCKIPILTSGNSNVAFDLFMVDSNTYQNPITGAGGYDNPHADQLAWMAANKDAGVNSLVFQHIPMPENYNLLKEGSSGTTKTYGGKTYIKELNSNATGYLGEFPCPPSAENNTGEFAALKAMGGVLGVFTGHDHLNDYTGTYDGINLTAVPGMTYYNYGDEEVRGYGVIDLNESDLSTYDYHTVKFNQLDAIMSDYALNVDFEGGNAIETSGNAAAIANTGSTVTYKFDSTLNKTVASFDGTSGFGYTLSETAKDKMRDGYTYEIMYKLPSVPGGNTDLASGMYSSKGFGTEYKTSANEFRYWQSFNESQEYRQLYYGADSKATGSWIHIVAVWDPTLRSGSGQMRGFINGVYKDYSNPGSTELQFAEGGEFYIGGNSNTSGAFRDGTACDIAFVRIHDKAYSDSEVADLYTAATAQGAGIVEGKYYPYDEITYSDLKKNTLPLDAAGFTFGGGNVLTYDATSPSYSAKLNFRWTVGSQTGIQFSFDKSGNSNMSYPFGVWVKKPSSDSAGANGAWHLKPTNGGLLVNMDSAASEGDTYDIELGRLKIAENAASHAGEYYVYLKVDGELIQETYSSVNPDGTYTSGSNTCRISNQLVFDDWGSTGNKISALPEGESYAAYDEVTYYDFIKNGTLLYSTNPNEYSISANKFTYNKTSASGSAVIKYRWKGANTGSSFYMSFDPPPKTSNANEAATEYTFGVMYSGSAGTVWLRIGNGSAKALSEPLTMGNDYDIEFARLKVATGENAGKYKLYFKIIDVGSNQDVYYEEKYIDANVVDANGQYTTNTDGAGSGVTCTISNSFNISFWGIGSGGVNKIAPIPFNETYYDYDEVTYYDMKIDGNDLPDSGLDLGTNRTLTYDVTSPTHSAVLKFRWKAGSTARFLLYFDAWSGNAYPFCLAVKNPGYDGLGAAAGANGAWHIDPSVGGHIVQMSTPITEGSTFDMEYGRLKVKEGPNAGKYYVYLKVDGVLTTSYYYDGVSADGTSYKNGTGTFTNQIRLNSSVSGNIFAPIPVPETYDSYDEVDYDDLLINGEPVNPSGMDFSSSRRCTYNATSPSYSAVLKFRWTAGNEAHVVLYFDEWSGNAYPFCLAIKKPGYSGLGAAAGANGAWHIDPSVGGHIVQMSEAITAGESRDIEYGRLKVLTGPRAGKYYVYLKVNDELVSYYYYDGVNSDGTYKGGVGTLTNNIIFTTKENGGDNFISATPVPYEPYDEVGYEDLRVGGNLLSNGTTGVSGATVFTYNRTSPTGSAIFRYRWKVGSVPKFQMSFEKTADNAMAYMFGAWMYEPDPSSYPQGKLWLRPSYGPEVNLASALTPGSEHNIEFARLKVSTGPDRGKYYVYIKIDNILVAEDYVAASVVDKNGDYTSNPGSKALNVKSGEILFTFWGSEGNVISAYKKAIRGDFDSSDAINSLDFISLRKAIIGLQDASGNPGEMADFNSDGDINVIDLVVMKKHLIAGNSYAKTGSLNLGTQEHLLESNGTFVDNTKTASYIAAASAVLGANSYRLSMPIHNLYYASSANGVIAKDNGKMAALKGMVAALKAQGINTILYVTDSYILPYGYTNPATNHNKTCPTPGTQDYENWLKVNAAAIGALAAEVPEIKFFEPFNEINLTTTGFEKPGIPWDASDQLAANYKYSVEEKAGIMADLCWYVSRAVKAVDPANQVTTPSICVGSHESTIESAYLNALYNAIASGTYPTNNALGDIRIDNYFTVINIHAYPEYATTSSARTTKVNNIANDIGNSIYSVMQAHHDGNSRVWLTETGVSVFGSRTESYAEDLITKLLNKINGSMTYIDTVIFYKVADASTSNGLSEPETKFGLFYAGDASSNRYAAKRTAKAVYKFFHNGSTDYTALNNLATNARGGAYGS